MTDAQKSTSQKSTSQKSTQISSDPADSAPAEGQSRSVPAQDQGKGTGGLDTADRAAPAEGSRDDGLEGAETSGALDHAEGSGRQ